VADRTASGDFYAVLQVHPSADHEVIEAAYRQLMKKHHPDMAGRDARLSAQYHERAKIINQAYGVLRDPVQRRRYDSMRNFGGDTSAAGRPSRAEPDDTAGARGASDPAPSRWPRAPASAAWAPGEGSMVSAVLRSPLAALAAVYYLLPGPYEWEGGHRQELLTTCLLPPVGLAAFALATGRLAPWVGQSPIQTFLAWGILAILVLPSWSSLPRLALAIAPSLVLLSGALNTLLHQASVPAWLAWTLVAFLSLVLSARLYLFAALPTLAACWLLTRLG